MSRPKPFELVTLDLSAVPSRLTGAGRYGVSLLAALSASTAGTDVRVVAVGTSGQGEALGEMAPSADWLDVVPPGRVARLAFEQLRLGPYLNRAGVDLHHGIHYTLPRGYKGKKVVTVHDATFLDHPEWHLRSKVVFFRRMMKIAAEQADAIIFPSKHAHDAYLRHFETAARLEVIPHGVQPERFLPPLGQTDASVLGAMGVTRPYFLFCGTLEPRKNLGRLLAAFEECPSGPTLVLAGLKGWKQAEVAEKLGRLVESGRAVVPGFVTDAQLGALYRGAIASVYPSLEEGFGLPGLEAMAQGCLLITSKGTAMEEYAASAAILVDPRDTSSLAQAMCQAFSAPDSFDSLVGAARERAATYTWQASARDHLALYRNILGL